MRTPARPPLDGLKKRLDRSRAERELKPRDGFLRETFVLPRTDARDKAKDWFDRWPKQAYWTEIESWFERPGGVISRLAPAPCLANRSSGLRNGHLSIDMQPQPMQSVSPSRSFVSCSMRRSRSSRHALDKTVQSSRVGVRLSGREPSAAAMPASGMPTSCAMRMTAMRRSTSRP